ncbi:MAG: ATPase, partial [Ruminococcaceae bacterium]|nr:ATPase [Oscillospiraceae bacterium]
MIFKRKIYDKLLDWKENYSSEKALLIEGARRIGKSTIAEEFGKNEYRSYIIIDFNDASQLVKDAFEKYLNDLDTFF